MELYDLFDGGTYARAAVGTIPTSAGFSWSAIAEVAANVRRVWDPGMGVGRGVLIEGPATQSQINTATFSSGWTATNAAVDADATTAPDGSVTADRLRAVAGGSEARISRSQGPGAKPFQLWQVFLRKDTSAMASIELVSSGATTATVDIDLPADGTWKIYSVKIVSTVAQCNVRVRPHKSTASPSAGDAIFVWGGNMFSNSSSSMCHPIGTYVPGTNPATAKPSEQLDYSTAEYDERILTEPHWSYFVPLFSWDGTMPVDKYGGDGTFESYGGAANESLWANSDTGTTGAAGAVRVRAENGPSHTRCMTTPLTFSYGQLMAREVNPREGRVRVYGATTGGSPVVTAPATGGVQWNQPWAWPSVTMRVGGRADEGTSGAHNPNWIAFPVYLGTYPGPLEIAS